MHALRRSALSAAANIALRCSYALRAHGLNRNAAPSKAAASTVLARSGWLRMSWVPPFHAARRAFRLRLCVCNAHAYVLSTMGDENVLAQHDVARETCGHREDPRRKNFQRTAVLTLQRYTCRSTREKSYAGPPKGDARRRRAVRDMTQG